MSATDEWAPLESEDFGDPEQMEGSIDGLDRSEVDEGLDPGEPEVLVLQEQAIALELPVWEPTGDPEVDAALDELTSLGNLSLAEHAPVFDGVYRRLHGRLSNLAAGTP